jgi:hypothetical protein
MTSEDMLERLVIEGDNEGNAAQVIRRAPQYAWKGRSESYASCSPS